MFKFNSLIELIPLQEFLWFVIAVLLVICAMMWGSNRKAERGFRTLLEKKEREAQGRRALRLQDERANVGSRIYNALKRAAKLQQRPELHITRLNDGMHCTITLGWKDPGAAVHDDLGYSGHLVVEISVQYVMNANEIYVSYDEDDRSFAVGEFTTSEEDIRGAIRLATEHLDVYVRNKKVDITV